MLFCRCILSITNWRSTNAANTGLNSARAMKYRQNFFLLRLGNRARSADDARQCRADSC
jgi:hypothetical protein